MTSTKILDAATIVLDGSTQELSTLTLQADTSAGFLELYISGAKAGAILGVLFFNALQEDVSANGLKAFAPYAQQVTLRADAAGNALIKTPVEIMPGGSTLHFAVQAAQDRDDLAAEFTLNAYAVEL